MKYLLAVLTMFACATKAQIKKVIQPADPHVKYDSEFLYWCKAEAKAWPVFIKKPLGCMEVSRGEWDHYPLSVNVADNSLMTETLEAIEAINRELGFEMLKFEVSNYSPDIALVVAGTHTRAAAEAKFFTLEGRQRGGVLVYNGLENQDRSDVLMHELGHLLGLRHDRDNRMSIMYPSATTRVARFEKQDVTALRQIYLKK